jgi:P4 family phage/plasmid primase-like protien
MSGDGRKLTIPLSWAPGVVLLCGPEPHSHANEPCKTPGKRPVEKGFNSAAADRWTNNRPESWDQRLKIIQAHLAKGKNVGLVPPPGVLVLDADSEPAVAWLDKVLPNGVPVQRRLAREGGWVPGKAHYYVRMSPELAARAKAKQIRFESPDGEVIIDLRCPGKSQAVVTPSMHSSGNDYSWDVPLPEAIEDVPMCPPEVEEVLLSFHARRDVREVRRATRKVAKAREPRPVVGEIPGHDKVRCFVNRWCRYGRNELEVLERARVFAAKVFADRPERLNEALASGGEVERLVRSGWEMFGGANPLHEMCTDVAVARVFLAWAEERFKYDVIARSWREKDEDGVWGVSAPENVHGALVELGDVLFEDASEMVEDPDRRERLTRVSLSLKQIGWIKRVEAMARALAPVATADFDSNPDLLFVRGGVVINSRLGCLLPIATLEERFLPTRAMGTDFETPTAGGAKSWEDFVSRTFGSIEMTDFVRRAVGCTMLGRYKPHVLFFIFGQGGTGKSTFLMALSRFFGSYAEKFTFDLFTGDKPMNANNASPEVARLKGVRMAYCSEIGSRARIGARMKDLTGGEVLNARHLYGNPFQFDPTHTVWVAGNDAPSADFLDSGVERRLKIMPADVRADTPDMLLVMKLTTEDGLRSIGAWALAGLREVLGRIESGQDVLGEPPEVREAAREYWGSMNPVEEWLQAEDVRGPGEVTIADAHKRFLDWMENVHGLKANHSGVPDRQRFGRALKRAKFVVRRGAKGVRLVTGMRFGSNRPQGVRYPQMRNS